MAETVNDTRLDLTKTGDEFRASLRDDREVYYRGERIDDVTTHVATAKGIDTIAGMFDAQQQPAGQDVLTYVRDDGARVTAAYMLPRTPEDLAFRREGIEFVARQTFGMWGRGIDMIATLPVGMASEFPSFKAASPDYADNILTYLKHCEDNNIHLAETIVDPQGYRARATGTPPDTLPPERATARIVKEDSTGIWISGIKGVGTVAPQANEIILGSFHAPSAEESFWVAVPVGTPGLRMFCREMIHVPTESRADHPIDAMGEEIESLVAFDEVFVPRERILAAHEPSLHGVNFYNEWAQHEHWYTFVRIMAKAEMFAGLAQLLVDTLGLDGVPVVRQRVADILEWAQICRALALAAEQKATPSQTGVLVPDRAMITAARSYALTHLPQVIHILQDISGQGLILRFSEKDLGQNAAFGKDLGWFLDTRDVSARDKNRVLNLVWDVTSSAAAQRSKLFEESNALNVPFLKERLYGEYERAQLVDDCRHFIGLGQAAPRVYKKEILQTWSERRDGGDAA